MDQYSDMHMTRLSYMRIRDFHSFNGLILKLKYLYDGISKIEAKNVGWSTLMEMVKRIYALSNIGGLSFLSGLSPVKPIGSMLSAIPAKLLLSQGFLANFFAAMKWTHIVGHHYTSLKVYYLNSSLIKIFMP